MLPAERSEADPPGTGIEPARGISLTGSAVRFGKWKLLEYFEDGGLELYNLEEDIGEKHNLAKTRPGKAGELLAMLQSWRFELIAFRPYAGFSLPCQKGPRP